MGKNTKKAVEEIEELGSTIADLPEEEAKKIVEDLEGDDK